MVSRFYFHRLTVGEDLLQILRKKNHLLLVILGVTLLLITSNTVLGDDDEDDDGIGFIDSDTAKDIGYVAIGLIGAGMINVILLDIFKISRKLLSEEGVSGKVRNFTRESYLKTRKPLNWLHYIFTLSATTIIFLHGLRFLNKEEEIGVLGWIATGIFLLYILTGVIIKLKVKPFMSSKIARRVLNLLHRNLLIFIGVIIIHVIHIFMDD